MSEAMTKQPDPLREWWDELTPDDQWEAFRIEKSNADAALRVTDTHTEPDSDPECDCEPRHVWPCATIGRCDEPGCEREATCGWPSRPGGTGPNGGYRRTCGPHMEATR